MLPAFPTLEVARMVSLGSILAAATVGVTLLVTEHPLPVRAVGLAIVAFIIWAHRANIGRIGKVVQAAGIKPE